MSEKPKFYGMFQGTAENLATIVYIKSNGKDFAVEFPEWVIPLINEQCIERSIHSLTDAFYRVRPDLRKQ